MSKSKVVLTIESIDADESPARSPIRPDALSFIEANRQLGSTTSLVKAAIEHDGYLVVHNTQMKRHVLKMNVQLRADRVFTLGEISQGIHRGREGKQVFVDAACLCSVR